MNRNMSDLEGRARREADDYQVNDWLIYIEPVAKIIISN